MNAVAELWSNRRFLEAKAEAGPQGIFAFADDLAEAVASAWRGSFASTCWHWFSKLSAAICIDRHLTTLFQCLWEFGLVV
ncbi:MAG: hypothetical protein U0872_00485 [Planctomycetaceae bacterium]